MATPEVEAPETPTPVLARRRFANISTFRKKGDGNHPQIDKEKSHENSDLINDFRIFLLL